MSKASTILIIKLGALGDFVQALGPFAAIRHHHAWDKLVLLTTPPYASLAKKSGMFDEVQDFGRPEWWRFGQTRRLKSWLRHLNPARVYDLQTSKQSNHLFSLFLDPKPEWSGIVAGCSHPHVNSRRNNLHTVERQAEQLAAIGVSKQVNMDISWLDADTSHFNLPERYILITPGGAPHRPKKRWPHYGNLACRLINSGIRPVLLGTTRERRLADNILSKCPDAVNLIDRTSLFEIAGLARHASGAVGNDTGPMHIIAATGCASLVLYSHNSDPALCAQRGPNVRILRKPNLRDLTPEEVEAQLSLS